MFPSVEIELTKTIGGKRVTYLRYELTNVFLTSYATKAAKRPQDAVGLNFEAVTATYSEYDPSGQKKGESSFSFRRDGA